MKTLHTFLPAAGLCAALLAGGVLAGLAVVEPVEAVRSVDISRVLQEFEPMNRAYETLRVKYQEQGDRLRKTSDELKAEKGQLAQLDRASEEFAVRSFGVQLGEKTLQEELDFWTGAQRREMEVLLERSVRRIHLACEEYGLQSGLSAVLMRPGLLPEDGKELGTLRELESRWVIWANPAHDATDAILALLREQG
jgi:Skp family chaperone for outer membrane proteins